MCVCGYMCSLAHTRAHGDFLSWFATNEVKPKPRARTCSVLLLRDVLARSSLPTHTHTHARGRSYPAFGYREAAAARSFQRRHSAQQLVRRARLTLPTYMRASTHNIAAAFPRIRRHTYGESECTRERRACAPVCVWWLGCVGMCVRTRERVCVRLHHCSTSSQREQRRDDNTQFSLSQRN